MTGQEIRDLGYLKWRDPWAWMETMKGKRWENLLKNEQHIFNALAKQSAVEKETRQMEKEIIQAQQYSRLPSFKIGCGTIDIMLVPNFRFQWKWSWEKIGKSAFDIDVKGNIVWYIAPDNEGQDKNKLICESSDGKIIWTKKGVSSQIAVVNELCYFIKVVDYFTTVELCVCNAQTGNDERILYKERDKTKDLNIKKTANKTLYLTSDDPKSCSLYKVDGLNIIQLAKNTKDQMPLGESIYGDDCLLVRNSPFEKWTARGKPINEWILPDEEIEWINLQSGNIITINEGSQSIWYCTSKKKPELLFKIKVGIIEPNIWSQWENTLVQSFAIKSPYEVPYLIKIINNKVMRDERVVQITDPIKFAPLDVHRFYALSKDGTKVPYIAIYQKNIKPKALFIYVYGAYGSTTPVGWPYNSWYPLLKRRWALIFSLIRGGGDIDAGWAEMARRDNRHLAIEDFQAVIESSQHKFKLGADKTVIYGRSAGGLPVGTIVSRFPNGNLVGAAFTEVPYVDVLRTASNPELPLTIGEYEEFGNPIERILNFKELLSVSPINTLPSDGAPGVFVMTRVGLLDKQVFAYESFKWIQKLRGNITGNETNNSDAKGKYITFERNESHHYRPSRFPRFRAIDLAILESWVEGKLKI